MSCFFSEYLIIIQKCCNHLQMATKSCVCDHLHFDITPIMAFKHKVLGNMTISDMRHGQKHICDLGRNKQQRYATLGYGSGGHYFFSNNVLEGIRYFISPYLGSKHVYFDNKQSIMV